MSVKLKHKMKVSKIRASSSQRNTLLTDSDVLEWIWVRALLLRFKRW